jgi:nucleotidyltransferase substrate binding protein (TIGR01987 family)
MEGDKWHIIFRKELYMKKLDNFANCLDILKQADFDLADSNDIYRMGVSVQFNLTFELAWKALQEVLRMHGVEGAETGSPREILQVGYKVGFVNDSSVWLLMLKKRNTSIHIYNEEEIDELIVFIRDSFIPAFTELEETLQEKLIEVDEW